MRIKSKIASLITILFLFCTSIFYISNLKKFIIITTDSMVPTINIGDIIYFEFKDPSKIYANETNGDILVLKDLSYFYNHGVAPFSFNFMPSDIPVIHRAIDVIFNETDQLYYYETKGDIARYSDGCARGNYSNGFGFFLLNYSNPILIPETEIIGVVCFKIPYLGFLGIFSSQITILLFIIVVFIIFINKITCNYKIIIKKNTE